MDEDAFWKAMEVRVCHEFAEMPERRHRFWWCDGFIPKQYLVEDATPRIIGITWICNGADQEEWEFTLFLNGRVSTREAVDWQANLPPENVTCWIAFDEKRKLIQFEPTAAVPDLR
jgi:hypothetical protein